MFSLWMLDNKAVFRKSVAHRVGDVVDTGSFEIGVARRGIDEDSARGDGDQNVGEIERHLRRAVAVKRIDSRHVPRGGPALEVAAVVLGEGGKPATGDDRADSIVERGSEKSVVPSERVSDGNDA